MNRRILYFSGYRMKVFEWRHNKLLGSHAFEPDDQGFENFQFYLKNSPVVPTQLLVDLIEEDFRQDHIPHVTGKAYKILISRLIDRHYRDESFIHVENLGREKDGRKDDKILLSVLTNQSILKPWLDLLKACECPLAGIWSVPLISKQLLPLIAPNEKNVLLLSRLIRSAQRETYFKDGALLLSRQAKLDRDQRDSEKSLVTTDSLISGVQQIHIFLTNQRIMAFNEPLNVFCIVPAEFLQSLTNKQLDGEKIKYHYVDLDFLFKKFNIRKTDDYAADVLFSFLCARMPILHDHYATTKEKLFFHRYLFSKFMLWGTLLGSMALLLASGMLLLNEKELRQKVELTESTREALVRRFNVDFLPLEQPMADTANIETSVHLAARLAGETANSPENYFSLLSPVFSRPGFSDIHLESFHWKKYSAQLLSEYLATEEASVAAEKSEAVEEEYLGEMAEQNPEDNLQVLLKLSGYITRKERDYREVVQMMDDFVNQLSGIDGVTKIVILKLPVDVRPGVTLTDDLKTDQSNTERYKSKLLNEFEILIAFGKKQPIDDSQENVMESYNE